MSMYNSYYSVSTVGGDVNMATTTVGAGGSQPTVVVVTTMYSNAGNAVTPNESEFRSKFVALIAGLWLASSLGT